VSASGAPFSFWSFRCLTSRGWCAGAPGPPRKFLAFSSRSLFVSTLFVTRQKVSLTS
jgi:hypothetical protein